MSEPVTSSPVVLTVCAIHPDEPLVLVKIKDGVAHGACESCAAVQRHLRVARLWFAKGEAEMQMVMPADAPALTGEKP